jgi:hypothetical protein
VIFARAARRALTIPRSLTCHGACYSSPSTPLWRNPWFLELKVRALADSTPSAAEFNDLGSSVAVVVHHRSGLVAYFLVKMGQGIGIVVPHVALFTVHSGDILVYTGVAPDKLGHAQIFQFGIAC